VTRLPDLTRESARDAAREELSRREYADAQPPLLVRLVGRALRALGDLLDRAAGAVPGGRLGLLLLLALLVLLVAVVLARVRPGAGREAARAPLFAGSAVLTAAAHRALAEQAAADGRFDEAVRERLRAVVRDLEARGVLDPRPGRTAGEVARDGGAALPAVAGDLRRGAAVFDEVWYGGRPADTSSYAVLVDVDERVGRSRMSTT
jgi:hypothetical protein